jgi:S1-C subfamily serine protease
VVHVTSVALRRDRFTLNVFKIPAGSGSGFVWDDQGRIVTNFHVVKGASEIQVTLADQSTWNATRVRYDEDKDLAVLWIDAPKDRLHPLPLGESNNLLVGQKVFAIGNPFGLDQSLSTGIISALGREIGTEESGRVIKGVIQTDAAINPGNSGGPLLDSAGRLIGVNTAIVSPTGAYAGIGFAIPVDEVNQVVTRLIRDEKVQRPILGIVPGPDQVARQRGISGVIVYEVVQGGPAHKAGLRGLWSDDFGRIRIGDVIRAIDGKEVKSTKSLFSILEGCKVGQEVNVLIWRDGEEMEVTLTLGADPR